MKTKEELNAIKNEVETLTRKLAELNEDELKRVAGGWGYQEFEVFLPGSEQSEGEKLGDQVAFFPGLSGFP